MSVYKRLQRAPSERTSSNSITPRPDLLETAEETGIYQGSFRRVNLDPDEAPRNVNAIVHSLIANLEEEDEHSRSSTIEEEVQFMVNGQEGGVAADDEEEFFGSFTSVHKKRNYLRAYFCRHLTCVMAGMLVLIIVFMLGITMGANLKKSDESQTKEPVGQSYARTVKLPPSDLEEMCSPEIYKNYENGLEPCESACAQGECCIADDKANNCYENNPEICELYSVCLQTAESPKKQLSKTPPPENIAEVCSPEIVAQSKYACTQACAPSLCCFALETSRDCYSFGDNHLICDQYRNFCSVLGSLYGGLDNDNQIEESSESVQLLDAPNSLEYWCSGQDMLNCQTECDKARCCLDSDIKTCVADLDTCFTYIYCDRAIPEFDNMLAKIAETFRSSRPEDGIVPYPPTWLSIECEKAEGDFPALSVVCHALCLPVSECCVETDAEKKLFRK